MTIYFNLSTSYNWRRHPVGIVRVERELARYLAEHRPGETQFCNFSSERNVFEALTVEQVDEVLSDAWCAPPPTPAPPPAIELPTAAVSEPASQSRLSRWVSSVREKWSPSQQIETPASDAGVDHAPPPERFSQGGTGIAQEMKVTDTFVSVGLDWNFAPAANVEQLKQQAGCRVVLGCHDVIPLLFPEFCYQVDFPQEFRAHYSIVSRIADAVWVNSDCTHNDFVRFLAAVDSGPRAVDVRKVQLASLRKSNEVHALSPADTSRLEVLRASGSFAVYVSTIEGRKNHRLLVDLWKDLHAAGEQVPNLVCIGMRGWGVEDLITEASRSSAGQAGKIRFLTDVGDELLHHIYSECQFGLFPSLYEGWGLAATELLAYGKVCVVANNSSLPEACQHLCPALHPRDYFGWRDEILQLSKDTPYRHKAEETIRRTYRSRSWVDFAREFVEFLDEPQHSVAAQ